MQSKCYQWRVLSPGFKRKLGSQGTRLWKDQSQYVVIVHTLGTSKDVVGPQSSPTAWVIETGTGLYYRSSWWTHNQPHLWSQRHHHAQGLQTHPQEGDHPWVAEVAHDGQLLSKVTVLLHAALLVACSTEDLHSNGAIIVRTSHYL